MPYRIEYSPECEDLLRAMTARDRAIVLDAVDRQLAHQPTVETRNRKLMRPNPVALWELRIDDLRVYYKEKIDQVLKTLTDCEREIIKLRYGLGDDYTYTLEEVDRIFKVTRERVRQIEAKAVRKLQHDVNDSPDPVVYVLAVGIKVHNIVRIGGISFPS